MFELDQKLQEDTHFIADLEISRLLLMKDSNYLWLILVPRVAGAIELIDLSLDQQKEILTEINLVGKILKESFLVEKLNIAAIGNVVRQLHIHIVGRFKNDASFPKPVWGTLPAKSYTKQDIEELVQKIQSLIK